MNIIAEIGLNHLGMKIEISDYLDYLFDSDVLAVLGS